MTPDQHQKTRRYVRDLGVVQSQESLIIQLRQGIEILEACGLYDAADAVQRDTGVRLDIHRVDL